MMNKMLKIALNSMVIMSLGAVYVHADDANKGKMLYMKKLKEVCGFNGAIMATKHSMSEWEKIQKKDKLADELRKFCPKVQDKALKERFMPYYYDFFHKYANDSGNIPAC